MSLLLKRALDQAAVWHHKQQRKYPSVEVPYVSEWRRNTVGDLTSMLNLAAPIDLTMPPMPNTELLAWVAGYEQAYLPPPLMPTVQRPSR